MAERRNPPEPEFSAPGESSGITADQAPPAPTLTTPEHQPDSLPGWSVFVQTAEINQVMGRFSQEASAIIADSGLNDYCCLALLEPEDSISEFDLDQVYAALRRLNPGREKDVLLVVLSSGGSIEPAYQISKICKKFARQKFVVCVPRKAKSAATLIALGADEIHMGPLGHLGPIDPQLGGLPALGLSQALETIAKLTERYPKSADMFARYLRLAVTVEQIGYYDRISESAEQYATRLLLTKSQLAKRAATIAHELVHEYKDHRFVIDLSEAQEHLGSDWVRTATPELALAEDLYYLFDSVDLFLDVYRNKKLLVLGAVDENLHIFDRRRPERGA